MSHILPCVASLALSLPGFAQGFTESYENNSDEGDFEIWWDNYNTIQSPGGNPGAYLELDNTQGSATCHFLEILGREWPSAFSGDWRARGITSVGLDVNILQGSYAGGVLEVVLGTDNGTPDKADDCRMRYFAPDIPPQAPGWTSYDFPCDASSMVMPLDWGVEGTCTGVTADQIWNSIIQDVDYIEFRMDTNPASFCTFTSWQFGVDNIRIEGGLVASNYCSTSNNSTGSPAIISAAGSNSVADNNLTLTAGPVPNNIGLFFYGPTQTQVPFGNGFRCITGSIVRLNPPASSSGNTATRVVDLLTQGIGVGSTNFQHWYRDPAGGGALFNLSDGLEVGFTP